MPGFSLHHHHFVPGFPSMAWPMIEDVLDREYRHLFASAPDIELTVLALHAREGDLIDLMQQMVSRYPEVRFSSLPSFGTDTLPPHIEFGLTGQASLTHAAMDTLVGGLQAQGYALGEVTQRS
jgi:molybdopterin-biosynthesis enzyme MoeA-like protein